MRRFGCPIAPVLLSAGLLFWTGCAGPIAPEPHMHGASIAHTHVGPNGGRLIVLGDEDYHAELLIDHSAGNATVFILDRTGRNPVPVDQNEITLNVRRDGQPHQIRLAAAGSASAGPDSPARFTGASDVLRNDCQLSGRLSIVINGKPYTGRVAHREDDHNFIR